jgi:cell division protein FtsA
MALHTPLQIAENVKIRHGNLIETSNEIIELPIIGDEENRNGVSLEIVHSVIFARVEEALMILAKSLEKSALKEQIGAGIILTGGMTKLRGIRELAQSIFPAMPVRIGKPQDIEGLFEELKDPAYATVVGLLLYKSGRHTQYEINFNGEMLHSKSHHTDNLNDLKLETVEEPAAAAPVTPEVTYHEEQEEGSTIIFDDLPDPNAEKSSPIKKLTNWAKQLF